MLTAMFKNNGEAIQNVGRKSRITSLLHIFISFQFASRQVPSQLHPEQSETYEPPQTSTRKISTNPVYPQAVTGPWKVE